MHETLLDRGPLLISREIGEASPLVERRIPTFKWGIVKSYIVCATPRCGSSLLDEALKNTGMAGNPEEYFLPQNRRIWQRTWNTPTLSEYLAEVLNQGTSPNGVFGMKVMWGYFRQFSRQVQRLSGNRHQTIDTALASIFPELSYIWITRRDKVRQAVSHSKARQTNIWAVTDESLPIEVRKPVFSFQQIDFIVRQLEVHDAAWQRYFATHRIHPYTIFYEDFVEQYEQTAINIMRYLNIAMPGHIQFSPRHLQKQADQDSEEWVQRYYDLRKRKGLYQITASLNTLFVQCVRMPVLSQGL